MYQVSSQYLDWFLSYGPRLKFLHDDADDKDDDNAKAMTITRLFFLQKTDELKIRNSTKRSNVKVNIDICLQNCTHGPNFIAVASNIRK